MKEHLSSAEYEVFLKILDWSKERKLLFYWSPAGTFAPMYADSKSDRNNLIFIKPNGDIQIQFKYIFQKSPFNAGGKRVELIRKLNSLPSIHIEEERVGGTPTIPIKSLQVAHNLETFLESLDWLLMVIKENNSCNPGIRGNAIL